MRQVALVAIDAIRKIVEILFLIWVQVLAPLKRVDGLKGFAKCDLITYRPRKINSAELRVGLRKGLRKEGHIVTLRRFKLSSSLNPLEYFRPCQALEGPRIGRGRWLGASTVYFLIAHRSRDFQQTFRLARPIFARHWLLSHDSIYLEQSFGAATPRNYLGIALSPSSPSAAHMRVTSIRSVRCDQRFGSH
jgi:hypothetical protein